MPFFKKENTEIYFVHIPRTAGRYVTELFSFNNYDGEYTDVLGSYTVNDLIAAHIHYPFYNYYLEADRCENFAIVRNPVDKIWSAIDISYKRKRSLYNQETFMKDLEDMSFFCDYIDYERSHHSYACNWFRPQIDFVSHKTHVYKFEKGIDNNLSKWLNKTFNLDLNTLNERKYPRMQEETLYPKKYQITRKIKRNIKEYYIEDFRKFNY